MNFSKMPTEIMPRITFLHRHFRNYLFTIELNLSMSIASYINRKKYYEDKRSQSEKPLKFLTFFSDVCITKIVIFNWI